jgi:hypothetical protein
VKTYYKIVDENMKSLTCGATSRKLDVLYKINEWVYPKLEFAPLTVFESLVDAREFLNCYWYTNGWYKIFTCNIKKSRKKWGKSSYDINKIKKLKNQKKKVAHIFDPFPKGTVLADAVMLLEEIK